MQDEGASLKLEPEPLTDVKQAPLAFMSPMAGPKAPTWAVIRKHKPEPPCWRTQPAVSPHLGVLLELLPADGALLLRVLRRRTSGTLSSPPTGELLTHGHPFSSLPSPIASPSSAFPIPHLNTNLPQPCLEAQLHSTSFHTFTHTSPPHLTPVAAGP